MKLLAVMRVMNVADIGVTAAIVLLMCRERSWTMGETAAALGISTAAITGCIDRMDGQGLIERFRPEHGDRRVIKVRLTESGVALAAKLEESAK